MDEYEPMEGVTKQYDLEEELGLDELSGEENLTVGYDAEDNEIRAIYSGPHSFDPKDEVVDTTEHDCSFHVTPNKIIFQVNASMEELPRQVEYALANEVGRAVSDAGNGVDDDEEFKNQFDYVFGEEDDEAYDVLDLDDRAFDYRMDSWVLRE